MATQIDEQQQENAAVEEQADKILNGGDLVDQEAMNMNDMLDGLRITDKDNNSNEAKEEGKEEEPNGKGNEEKKIFCGGISYDTCDDDLNKHFSQFGPVKEAQVKYDRMTGRSRGFAFVEFETVEACKASLTQSEQTIKGKQCEVKPAKTREMGYMNKKIFVGGLPGEFPEEELRKHFEQYGPVEDVEWPFDKQTKARKNFAFVVFETEESANNAAASPKQQFANRECDVKKAVPQNRRPMYPRSMPLRGVFGGGAGGAMVGGTGGMRGGAGNLAAAAGHQQMPMYAQNAAAWYQMNATAAWYNAAYNGGAAWYGPPNGGTSGNPSAAQWYNSAGNNATNNAQATQWYGGHWYNNNNANNGPAAAHNGNPGANGDINGTA